MGKDDVRLFDESVGLLKRASIKRYLPDEDALEVKLATGESPIKGSDPLTPIKVQAPHSMFHNNGMFIGTLPAVGTPIIIGQGNTGWHFVSFIAENPTFVPELSLGELLIQTGDNNKITLLSTSTEPNRRASGGEISIGGDNNKIHISTVSNYITTNFNAENHFTQTARRVEGIVERDLVRYSQFSDDLKLDRDDYADLFKPVGMDPTVSTDTKIVKNPPLNEIREILYEFQYSSGVEDDLRESAKYGEQKPSSLDFSFPNRRKSRADTLSLSLVSPNYLMETVKGTVVDVFGNILDLNRYPLPVGKGFDQNTLDKDQSKDKIASYQLIRTLERKSIAYHFELNSRKDLTTSSGAAPDVTSNKDYARSRSRFFVDIDKEGQFKINIPSSSETGNIPLLTRYENYSTFGPEDNGNPNKQIYRGAGNNFDIYHDSFAADNITATSDIAGEKGSIKLVSGDKATTVPKDRITGNILHHGTAYHDILQTCSAQQNGQVLLDYQTGEQDPKTVDLSLIPDLKDIVTDTITISGTGAKAGGRSGQINMDGSLEWSIGANSIDRQSLWLDTAGGVVANIGRDIRGRSLMASCDGDFYLTVGGFGIKGDSRFPDTDDIKGGVLDLRIYTDGLYTHMIRCDANGITIMTPGNLGIHSSGDMTLTSDKDIRIECNTLVMQERMHLKTFGGSS